MSAACCYEDCGRAGATLRIAEGRYAHPVCFRRHDDEDEASLFAAVALPWFVPELRAGFDLLTERPRRDLTGREFGDLLVLEPAVQLHAAGHGTRYWVVRCKCGDVFEIQTSKLDGGQRACRRCSGRRGARLRKHQPAHVVLGLTVPQLARRAGVSEAAIRQRIRLGWPPKKIASPATRRAA